MKKIYQIILYFFAISASAQFSKTHYIPPVSNSPIQAGQGQYMYISCPSTTPVNFRINIIGGDVVEGTVSRDEPFVYLAGNGDNSQFLISSGTVGNVFNNKGFIVEADDQVYVTVRMTTTPQNFQAGSIVSKGLAALGKRFRVGAFVNEDVPEFTQNHYTFATVLATENNTTVSFSDIDFGVQLVNNGTNIQPDITLNRGESFCIATIGPADGNRNGLIGTLITSDKPIAVNCGSIAGTNGNASNLDLGFDQLVPAELTGSEYILIRGIGPDIVERSLIVADQDNTEVYLNDNTLTPAAVLNAGDYYAPTGNVYSPQGNLYINTSKSVFLFQSIGGSDPSVATPQANQNMCFVPPLKCETPKIIDNIPLINEIGGNASFTGTVAVVTEVGSTLSFILNGTNYTIANLPPNINVNGPVPVTGNTNFETYTFQGFTGNVSVYSSSQVYVSYYGTSGAATYGGFYSGFTFKPEIAFKAVDTEVEANCIPNIELSVNELTAFDQFQWEFNGNPIPGANSGVYIPQEVANGGLGPGFYAVRATISDCGTTLVSNEIPVSTCALDSDADGTINDVDLDLDNDGIANCTESYGDFTLNTAAVGQTPISVQNYNNAYTITNTPSFIATPQSFQGFTNGNFITTVPVGLTNEMTVQFSSLQPISIGITYPISSTVNAQIDSAGDFRILSTPEKNISIINPADLLLIDTNYDGIYESGITQFSGFDVRFRLNSGSPLALGTGNFEIKASDVTLLYFIHKNLSETDVNTAIFNLRATCLPRDTDGDGIFDYNDLDTDNDGIPDPIEAAGVAFQNIPFADTNANGINDAIEPGLGTLDTDTDGVPDYVDLDSDNDGIYDLVEAGSAAVDTDGNGKIDGASFGINGLANILETTVESGQINFTPANADSTTEFANYIDLDSDDDDCNDVNEAGFTDADNDGRLGSSPLTVDSNGLVTSSATGYTPLTSNDYVVPGIITVTQQPQDVTACQTFTAQFSVQTNAIAGYQWQESSDGLTFVDLPENSVYQGTQTATLTINNLQPAINNFRYRARLLQTANACGDFSASATLTVLPKPQIIDNFILKQCDTDLDNIAPFNLEQANTGISANAANETFVYYLSQLGAQNQISSEEIQNPQSFSNSVQSTVFVRVTDNSSGCVSIGTVNLNISATTIPAGTLYSFSKCDDFVDATNDDRDGISTFDFSPAENQIRNLFGGNPNINIRFYRTEADATVETDAAGSSLAITNINSYRNIGFPGGQQIWVRVDSTTDNACFGLGPYINLTVEELPTFNEPSIPRQCDRILNDGSIDFVFDTSNISAQILNGQANITLTFLAQDGTVIGNALPNPFLTQTQTITVNMVNNSTNDPNGPCVETGSITFTVDERPTPLTALTFIACDDEPVDNDGFSVFDTSTVQNTITQGQTSFSTRYFDENGNLLFDVFPSSFNSNTQVITAEIYNANNPNCSETAVLSFTVNPLPNIDEVDENIYYLCSNLDDNLTLEAGVLGGIFTDYTYTWFRNGEEIPGQIRPVYTANTAGDYSVRVSDRFTQCSRTRTFTVLDSGIATISNIVVEDLRDKNTVLIEVTGSGTYEYSIDNEFGPYQTDNFFEDVAPGLHTVYVNDVNGCGQISREIAVIGAMKFFTPNGDGYNDFWRIKGINALYFPQSYVYVFDRYGKFVFEITAGNEIGWDGTLNGNPLPADDYWYVLYVSDGRIDRGHFTLKR
ncbi:T9SS type B sorting domain-containing protein [Flavobacterium sp.]|uniref:T9SS type B sorting domain-containing protein n=1 Tax=Flavobacterium sp. TaxID=239 RepID=UPI00261F722D|nr:T9SS type B sorting domain-containing protein [Flavobacterium sp.]